MQKALWPADTFVDFDHGLNKAINKIREALGDSAESPRFVETVARRGYRFIADVKVADTVSVGSPSPAIHTLAVTDSPPATDAHPPQNEAVKIATSTPVSPAWAIAALLMLVLLGLAAWRFSRAGHAGTVIRSLAVLPLENLSNDASQEYFADGMTDELIATSARSARYG